MVRTVGSSRDKTWPLIREACVDLLFEHGYDSMNTRQLAREVGLKPGSLYYYFDSKEELLYRLVNELMEDILSDLEQRLDGVEDPQSRLAVYVETLVRWHVSRHKESFIARMDIRNLSADRLDTYLAHRDRFDVILDSILAAGSKAGVFSPDPKHLMRLSVLTMVTGISNWYRVGGPSKPAEISRFYGDLINQMVRSGLE